MATTLNLTGFKLTFDEEFNSLSLDPAGSGSGTWDTHFMAWGLRNLGGNGEQEYYSDSTTGYNPFSLSTVNGHGTLNINAEPTPSNLASSSGNLPYLSGMISTENSFSQTYGYFEMKAQLPSGSGLWPAFWLLNKNGAWPPELDVMEAFGGPAPDGEGGTNLYHVATHSSSSSGNNGGWETINGNITSGFHTYGVDWEPSTVTFYFDGQETAQYATPSDMNSPMYMIANLAVGGSWPGSPTSGTHFPADMQIQYIHAYSNAASATAITPQAGYTASGSGSTGTGSSGSGSTGTGSTGTGSSGSGSTGTGSSGSGSTGTGSTEIDVNAAGAVVAGSGDHFNLLVDGVNVGQATTSSATAQTFVFHANVAANTAHTIDLQYDNSYYWNGDTRNLTVNSFTINGHVVSPTSSMVSYHINPNDAPGGTNYTQAGTTTLPYDGDLIVSAPSSYFPSTSSTTTDTLIKVTASEDYYKGNAEFQLVINGQKWGPVETVSAIHNQGQTQDFYIHTTSLPMNLSSVGVDFLNDAYGGRASLDRNLYVSDVQVNGVDMAPSPTALYHTGDTAWAPVSQHPEIWDATHLAFAHADTHPLVS